MSRGPGRTMRAVMEHLTEPHQLREYTGYWTSAYVIAWSIAKAEFEAEFGHSWTIADPNVEPSPSQVESVRRAIKTLARDGRVETCRRWDLDRPKWSGLHCRLTEAEFERLNVGELPTLSPGAAGDAIAQLQEAIGGGG